MAGSIVVLIAMALALGYGAWRALRITGLDDYREGYEVGASARQEGIDVNCQNLMEARYGKDSWVDPAPGWGEFAAGCRDGLAGETEAAWYQLSARVPVANDD